jgi:hypothetical protein
VNPNNTVLTHDASSTWSGYLYQGEIALYVALYYINHPAILGCNAQDIGSRAGIEIEWLEDFSIKVDREYFSVHQVKAKKEDSIGSYKSALWKLIHKLERGYGNNAYLHTCKQLTNTPFKLDNIKIVPTDPTRTSELSAIQQRILGLEEVAKTELEKKVYLNINNEGWDLVIPLGKDLEEKIIEQILIYYQSHNHQNINPSFLQNAYRYLCVDLMNAHIKSRHIKIQDDKLIDTNNSSNKVPNRFINFSQIETLLINVPQEANSEIFAYYLRKRLWDSYYYMLDKDWLQSDELSRLYNEYLIKIKDLDDKKLTEFICGLVINKKIISDSVDINDFISLVQEHYPNGYHKPLYWCLGKTIKIATIDHKNDIGSIYWKIEENDIVEILLATIIYGEEDYMDSFADDILKNSIDKLYKIKFILTKNYNGNLFEASTKVTKSDFESDVQVKSEEFTKIKNVEFISQDNAINKLNLI